MTYRELQAKLKEYRDQGLTEIRLNASHEKLEAEVLRLELAPLRGAIEARYKVGDVVITKNDVSGVVIEKSPANICIKFHEGIFGYDYVNFSLSNPNHLKRLDCGVFINDYFDEEIQGWYDEEFKLEVKRIRAYVDYYNNYYDEPVTQEPAATPCSITDDETVFDPIKGVVAMEGPSGERIPGPWSTEDTKQTCTKCDGYGYVTNNPGEEYEEEYECEDCYGTGLISISSEQEKCPSCENEAVFQCPRCNGKGLVEDPEAAPMATTFECPRCDTRCFIKKSETHNPEWLRQIPCPDCGKYDKLITAIPVEVHVIASEEEVRSYRGFYQARSPPRQ